MSMLAPPQSPDLQAQFQNAMTGVLRRPGRGKRKGQWVQSGGQFNNLTEDEIFGRLRARQGGNSGSGPGGGLRTGGLSGESGIDWLKRNGPSRSPSAREAVISGAGPSGGLRTGSLSGGGLRTGSLSGGESGVQSSAPAALHASLANPVGSTPKAPATPPVEVGPPASAAQPAPAEPLRITNVNGNSENTKGDTSKFVNGVDWSGGTSQPPPPVLQKPAASPIKAAGANQIAPAVAPTAALMNGEAPQKNPFAKKPLDNRLTAGLASNKRDKFSNKNPFV